MDILTDTITTVNSSLEDRPIAVYLPTGCYLLDMQSDEPMEPVPWQGEPMYGPEITAADYYGLEARA